MRRIVLIVLCTILIATISDAVVSIDTDVVKRSVFFFFAADRNGEADKTKQTATGFLVSVPTPADRLAYTFLVTARHVVDPVWAGCSEVNPSRIYIRVNRVGFDPNANESGVEYIPIDLVRNGKPLWFTNRDEHVDAALLLAPKALTEGKYEVTFLGLRNFGSDDEISKLGVGSDVASAGLVSGLQGVRRNYPIFKFGKISNIPDEMATLKCTKDSFTNPVRVWWIAINQVGGNSGAPIFFTPMFPPGADVTVGEPRAMLIGLQSLAVEGSDIAGMTPTKYIMQIIREHVGQDADLTLGVPRK